MIRPIVSLRSLLKHVVVPLETQAEPAAGTVEGQWSALERRRRLTVQHTRLADGASDYQARPPYPLRPRPPS
ncbi:MAG: hypothetical protein ACYTG0_21705 [Planctomycetota bacterium]|jgi:hypothetical protein